MQVLEENSVYLHCTAHIQSHQVQKRHKVGDLTNLIVSSVVTKISKNPEIHILVPESDAMQSMTKICFQNNQLKANLCIIRRITLTSCCNHEQYNRLHGEFALNEAAS